MGQERPLQLTHLPWLGVGLLGLDKLFVPGPGSNTPLGQGPSASPSPPQFTWV